LSIALSKNKCKPLILTENYALCDLKANRCKSDTHSVKNEQRVSSSAELTYKLRRGII